MNDWKYSQKKQSLLMILDDFHLCSRMTASSSLVISCSLSRMLLSPWVISSWALQPFISFIMLLRSSSSCLQPTCVCFTLSPSSNSCFSSSLFCFCTFLVHAHTYTHTVFTVYPGSYISNRWRPFHHQLLWDMEMIVLCTHSTFFLLPGQYYTQLEIWKYE